MPAPPAPSLAVRPRVAGAGLALAAVVAVALNLRAAISSVGPVLEEIQAGVELSAGAAGVLTSLPVLCFAVVGLASPWLGRRFGIERAIAAAVVVLGVSLLVRVAGGPVPLFLGTLTACGSIAAVNVLMTVVVKTRFPHRVGLVTGVYTSAMAGGSAAAAALSAPVAAAVGLADSGWRVALAVWAVPCLVAVALWFAALRRWRTQDGGAGAAGATGGEPTTGRAGDPAAGVRVAAQTAGGAVSDAPVAAARLGTEPVSASATASVPAAPRAVDARALLRYPRVWALTIFFGTQSLLFYVALGWLPAIYRDAGLDAATAGTLLSVSVLVGVPAFLVVPVLAARRPGQRRWTVGLTAAAAGGLVGLLVAPAEGAWLWAVLLGLGNACFPLALSLFALRTSVPAQTATVSAVGQSLGYLIAAAGPLAVGLLHEWTGSWTTPLLVLLGLMVVQAGTGMVAGRSGHIDD
ncbi:MFS transporter [Georgenia wangjunii]|uniref:MFS transporter n=1 Tax=Georgenia wangjunii TaxID=3117730 RepID=UPI002F264B6F